MADQTVSDTILRPDGSPASGITCRITLCVGSDGETGEGWKGSTGILPPKTVDTNSQGTWQLVLVSNDDITVPTGTYYKYEVLLPTGPPAPRYFTVPDSGGPFTISDRLLPAPPGVPVGAHGAADHVGDIFPNDADQTLGKASLDFTQRTADPSAPAAGHRLIYERTSDGHLVVATPSAVVDLETGGGGVAADAIWDAANDYVRGSGADTGVRQAASAATPQAIGTAAVGTASNPPSADNHVHATGAGTPSTQAFGDAAATGTGPAAAMTDHKHAMPTSTTGPDADVTPDAAGAAGTANTAARSGHGHKLNTSATAALATTTAAGTAGTSGHAPSRDDHTHQIGTHGATEHTDITDSIWCSAANMPGNNTDGSSLTGGGTLPDRLAFFTLADGATQGAYWNFKMPKRCKAGSTLTAVIHWTPSATDLVSHTVRWSIDVLAMVAGTGHGAAGTTTTFTGDSGVRTATQMVIETGVQILASVNPGDLIRFDIRRIGADGADTYAGIVNLAGVDFEFTAVQ